MDEALRAASWDEYIAFAEGCQNCNEPDLRRFKSGLLDRDSALARQKAETR